jgi:hypothetical protein
LLTENGTVPPGASPPRARLGDAVDVAMKPLARRLDADKMAKLGIRNTMRLAKRYNGLLHGALHRYRVELYRDRFRELLDENGGLTSEGYPRMQDGFALDTSMSLPHLDEALRAADEVIAERGGRQSVDDRYRAFFRNLIGEEDLSRWPAFLDFVSSSQLLATVAQYLGFIPTLSTTLPFGVRVVESGKHVDALAHLPPRDSQVFHIDPYDHPMVYVILLVRDCTSQSGPFTFLPASASARTSKALNYWSRGRPYRLGDEEIYSVADPGETMKLVYPRGTVLFVDTSRCFHYGARDGEVPRFQIMYGLTSVCRADFSETYMPRASYPVRPGDSRLQRLVLDRTAYGI